LLLLLARSACYCCCCCWHGRHAVVVVGTVGMLLLSLARSACYCCCCCCCCCRWHGRIAPHDTVVPEQGKHKGNTRKWATQGKHKGNTRKWTTQGRAQGQHKALAHAYLVVLARPCFKPDRCSNQQVLKACGLVLPQAPPTQQHGLILRLRKPARPGHGKQ
jgi:hypothetical protein